MTIHKLEENLVKQVKSFKKEECGGPKHIETLDKLTRIVTHKAEKELGITINKKKKMQTPPLTPEPIYSDETEVKEDRPRFVIKKVVNENDPNQWSYWWD